MSKSRVSEFRQCLPLTLWHCARSIARCNCDQRIAGASVGKQVNPYVPETRALAIELHQGGVTIGVEGALDRDGFHWEAAVRKADNERCTWDKDPADL